jgi:hypothetical protein
MIIDQETNMYCNQHYAGKRDDNSAPQDVTPEEMYLFLALILKTGHNWHNAVKEYWSRAQICHASSYFCIM